MKKVFFLILVGCLGSIIYFDVNYSGQNFREGLMFINIEALARGEAPGDNPVKYRGCYKDEDIKEDLGSPLDITICNKATTSSQMYKCLASKSGVFKDTQWEPTKWQCIL